ncbi:hypothetical protein L292_2095 [Acinetobacter junii CIP 107470 = MTCC 11364]|uniref:Uncharacterized protein n=1 Tax=Acinetobacter junii CIP 107470 = MTCC 11364 TaxID=1217666 RepID=S7WUI7_ACIJU|nr:DUF6012 family protein [Acinetobacter junii]ENV52085.1 hypothetical protein F953_00497 [Acinetobacter junii CIP 107470 = MTCC 11364]EPR86861.1 hypothetical protein L292_2095 [Acinetobacter junii CIP 107470 = MTCC 11364]
MLFHLVPKIYNPFSNIDNIQLLSISIPELNIDISENFLSLGKPYPNKNYYVGMLKNGRKATNGILIDLQSLELKSFTVYVKWILKIDEQQVELEHKIINHIEGDEINGLISHNAILWYGHKNFDINWPSPHMGQAPIEFQPALNLEKGGITHQVNEITLPILEVERLHSHIGAGDRMPKTIWKKVTI